MLTELYPPVHGGSAVLFHEIYRRLPGRVRIVTDPRERPIDPEGPPIVEHSVGTPNWGILSPRALGHHLCTGRLLRHMGNTSPAVVHCGRALPEGVAAWLARGVGGPRYVCWAHGEDLTTAQGSREFTFLTKRVYGMADFAIANSRNTGRILEEFGVEPRKIVVVYPGVDPTRFSPAIDGSAIRRRFADPGDVLLLSVGRLQRRKGHDLAIRAVAALHAQMPTVRYVIAGDGEERGRLEHMARECGVADRVHFAGAFAAEDLPALYAACDIFLLPNRIEAGDIEGFGIVFLEAASSGKATIGGNSGGVPEAVVDGGTGLLVGGTDVSELACAVARLAGDAALRHRFGDAGRERVLASFTWERAAAAVGELHRRVITRETRQPC